MEAALVAAVEVAVAAMERAVLSSNGAASRDGELREF